MEKLLKSKKIDQILEDFQNPQKSDLGKILLRFQDEFGFLNEDIFKKVAQHIGVTATEAYGYASFYSLYYLTKPGKYIIKICKGTACHIKDGPRIISDIEHYLEIKTGETTKDGLFKLEKVSCLGICASAPVIKIND
ncbi:MAG: NAD(P)H-dependent oxidoreductase subunit E, partial [Spirochaetes bacterium]|nr:NAD(P)H-dependent oxidoreductase subunit E [Spirochaetota bacterium]